MFILIAWLYVSRAGSSTTDLLLSPFCSLSFWSKTLSPAHIQGGVKHLIMCCPKTDFSIRNRNQLFLKRHNLEARTSLGSSLSCLTCDVLLLLRTAHTAYPLWDRQGGPAFSRGLLRDQRSKTMGKDFQLPCCSPWPWQSKCFHLPCVPPAPENTQHLHIFGLRYLCWKCHLPPTPHSNMVSLVKSSLTFLLKITFLYTLNLHPAEMFFCGCQHYLPLYSIFNSIVAPWTRLLPSWIAKT